MQYSPDEDHWHPEQLATLRTLLDCQNLNIIAKQGGGNSKVYCAEADGKKWAVKSYPPYAPNQRDRLATECLVYQFLNQQHIPSVPFLKGYSTTERWLIIDWISGEIPNQYTSSDIDQAITFLGNIAKLNTSPEAIALPLAAEPCISLEVLLNQIKQRFQRLMTLPEKEPELTDFLINQFQPVFEKCEQLALQGYYKNTISPSSELAQAKRSLIPADFGFHNSLRNPEGQLYFFDFDYFGWDDPVKLLADILWHPKMNLSDAQKKQFVKGIASVYHADSLFLARFYYTWSLFGLRWVLILLNEFIPAFWQNRQHANANQNQVEAKCTQLARAKELLITVQQMGCPYEITHTTII